MARLTDPADEPPPGAAPLSLPLPAAPRGPQVCLVAVGALLLAASVAIDPGAVHLLTGGLGLVLAGFGSAILVNREPKATLQLAAAARSVAVVGRAGGRAEIPVATIAGVDVATEGGGRPSHGVWLARRDGGRIQLARCRRAAEAEALAQQLRRHLDAQGQAGRPAQGLRGQGSQRESHARPRWLAVRSEEPGARAAERCLPRQTDRPQPAALHLSWPSARPLPATIPALVGTSGLGLAAYGLGTRGLGVAPAVVLGAVALLLALALLSGLGQIGQRESVSIDGETLAIAQERGERVLRRRPLPLARVAAVDYSHASDALGALLLVRTAAESGTEAEVPRAGIQLPLGALPLVDRINLALVLGDEIARRRALSAQSS